MWQVWNLPNLNLFPGQASPTQGGENDRIGGEGEGERGRERKREGERETASLGYPM